MRIAYEAAARILASHGTECRPSDEPDRIEARARYLDNDGNASSEWETVTMTRSAILDWLEY
jgi:hypothetical protein